MQLILSVQAGGISSSTLIRQLSHHSELNLLARFAEELGRVERTMFLLEWVSNQLLRQTVTGMTNKVESYHGFSKWLSFGGEVIAENDPDEQQKHIRYNDLLASAVILQNVIDMTKIIEELRREGWTITQEDLSFLCPYITPGLKRFGAYVMDLERDMEPFLQELLLRTRPAAQGTARRRAKEA
jgi:TnpA family transposase